MVGSSVDSLWYADRLGLAARALSLGLTPLSWAYGAALRARSKAVKPVRLARPVISVGNLTLGGAGKTPLVVELVRLLVASGRRVAVVSRGYGRLTRGARVVHAPGGKVPAAAVAGDEPAMLAARCPQAAIVVGEDRVDAAGLAIASFSPDAIVCDDAFQHIRLARDLDVLAIHAQRGLGNRRLFPRGPLREPKSALGRADLVVFAHARDEDAASLRRRHGIPPSLPAVPCRLEPDGLVVGRTLQPFCGRWPKRVLAACGIAHPAGFRESLHQAGLQVVDLVGFGDHHRFAGRDFKRLGQRLRETGAEALVVTEKDLVRIDELPAQLEIFALRLQARWQDQVAKERVVAALESAMARPSGEES